MMDEEKQIEEMAKIISDHCRTLPTCEGCKFEGTSTDEVECFDLFSASRIYNAGYRKQSEGEWINITRIHERLGIEVPQRWKCSCCDYLEYHGPTKYCGGCGAKMKGGAE